MVSRKRTHSEVDAAPAQQQLQQQPVEESGLLHRLRNCWEFANLMQYVSMFGNVMRIDEDFSIEVCRRVLSSARGDLVLVADMNVSIDDRIWKMNV